MTLGVAALGLAGVAILLGGFLARRFYRRWKAEGHPEPSPVGGILLRLSLVATGLLVAEAILLGGWLALRTFDPPAERLVDQLHPGMPLAEVRERAVKLGFEWRVDEARLSQPPASPAVKPGGEDAGAGLAGDPDAYRHVICHTTGEGLDLCENFDSVTSFGALFASASCDALVRNGVIDEVWFFMD